MEKSSEHSPHPEDGAEKLRRDELSRAVWDAIKDLKKMNLPPETT